MNPLHLALVFTELLGRVAPLALTPAWLALAAIAAWPWGDRRVPVALLTVAFTVVDGGGLALLPRLKRSFGPVTPPLLMLALARTTLTFLVGLVWATAGGLALVAGLQSLAALLFIYGTWVEPFRITVTERTLRSPKLTAGSPLRVLHLSDFHVERLTAREEALLDHVTDLAPDVVLLTGDYLNLSYVHDPQAHAESRRFLERLCAQARCPVYAVTGSPPVDNPDVVPRIFADLPLRWLQDRTATVTCHGQRIRLLGVHCHHERPVDGAALRALASEDREGEPFTILLYHSPDLMPEAVSLGIDLYLCGHTHGGQVRLPLFGALVTSSEFWKRYEMGLYQEGATTLYVSRGLGLEGMGAPRIRFLAPPEITLWTLSG
jgi:hypothetical protein